MKLYFAINVASVGSGNCAENAQRTYVEVEVKMAEIYTEWGNIPINNLKNCGEYLVKRYGGKLIQHTKFTYVYENSAGKRYAIRIANRDVQLVRRKYYVRYNCQEAYVGIRNKKEGEFFLGCIDIPEAGKKTRVTSETPGMRFEGNIM